MGNICVGMRECDYKDGYLRAISNSIWGHSSLEGLENFNKEVSSMTPSISKEHESSMLVQRKPPDLVLIVSDGKNTSKPINSEEFMKIVLKEVDKQSRVATIKRIPTDEHGIKGNKVIVGVGRPTPVEAPKPKIPSSIRKFISAGLEVDSVLKTKTCHLKEHYNLRDKLGNGQFGTTFLCVERATGKQYACKSIAKRKLLTLDDVDDVRTEVNIMRHLSKSPGIISIKDAYEDSVAVHIVMELCTGGELFDGIVKVGHYSERKAAVLFRTVVGVIKTCHSLGVMHRDLKPENFLFVNQGEDSPIMAIDFGLSVFFKPGETLNEVVGSPFYVAPEVLSKRYGPEADVWSAGVILYILLSGVPPFWGETVEEIFKKVLHGTLDFSSDPWPHVSESAKDLVQKMLVRDPKRRLTAHEVLDHPWIWDGSVAPDKPLNPPVFSRFTRFC